MKKYLLHITLLCLSLLGCNENISLPANLIEPEKMAYVLAEIQILEAAYNIQYARSDSSREIMKEYYNQIFEKFQVTQTAFEGSFDHYSMQPDQMIAIQEDVADLLLAREGELKPK